MKIKRRRPNRVDVCFLGLLKTTAEIVNGFEVFGLLSGEWVIRRRGELFPCGTFRTRDRALIIATIEGGQVKIKKKNRPAAPPPRSLPNELSFTYGARRPILNVEFVPDTRGLFFSFKDSWRGAWHICHFPTDSCLIFDAPSKAFALKVFANVLPYLDLHKINRVLWYGDRRPIPDAIEDYIANVWKCEYELDLIPTVKQWAKSGYGNSAEDVNQFRGTGKIKVKRKR